LAGRPYGKYTLIAKLATGGMAEIFLAKGQADAPFGPPERLVVVKKILDQLCVEPHFVEMFLDEARIAARMNHPNIVQIFDLGQVLDPEGATPRSYYIAMEYLPGESLGAIARRGASVQNFITAEYASRVLSEVLKGLEYAHTLRDKDGTPFKVVHRDIAPKNIVVTYDGQVKLVDFGIAKAAAKMKSTKTRVGVVKGTYQYMSPEQVSGGSVDHRSDVFACGVVLYELCTGTRLFRHDDPQECMRAICFDPIPPPRSLHPVLPERLERVIMRALERDVDRRYQSADAMREDLEAFLDTAGIPVRPADLGAYMKELFAERIAHAKGLLEAALAKDWEKYLFERERPESGDEDDEESALSSIVVRRRDVGLAEKPEVTGSKTEFPTNTSLQPGRRWRVTPLAVAAGVGGVLVAAGLLFLASAPAAKVEVRTTPAGAKLFLDGQQVAVPTPLAVPVKPGKRNLRIELEKYQSAEREVDVPRSGTVSVSIKLEPQRGQLRIESEPVGAKLTVNGDALPGKAPEAIGLPPGEHRLVAELDGYRRLESKVILKPAESRTVKLTLEKTPPPPPPAPPPDLAAKEKDKDKDPPGYLTLATEPASVIYLGAKELGQTPLLKVELPPGTHTLTAVNTKRGLRKKFNVTISSGKVRMQKEKLSK
jgi:serine/threonine-protein kinase